MDLVLFLRLCLLCLTQAAAGLQASADGGGPLMVGSLGDSISLPCGIPSVKSCSTVNWNMAGEFGSVTEVVKAGRLTAPNTIRLGLLKDCSLQINHLELNDARLYSCDNGSLNSTVSLRILEVTESSTPAVGTIELHCFLNTFKGFFPCNNKGIHIKWSTKDNTPLHGNRFRFENRSECLSKLIITKKATDHHRKWKCHLHQNDTVKATITYKTTIKDGIEEVVAAVGESVSLPCRDESSLSVEGVKWAEGESSDHMSPFKGQTEPSQVIKGSSLVISKVSAVHAGDYQCSEYTGQLSKIRLYTLDVTSENGPGGDNITLTCELTCSKECGKDFNITWSGGSQNSWQSGLMKGDDTLTNRLFLPVISTTDDITCFVHREGEVMASKKWSTGYSLQTTAWVTLLLALLICLTAGGIYIVRMKRKRNKDAGNEQTSIGMAHVYEVVQDVNNEEVHRQSQTKRGPATTDSFYDLLQAVN